MIVATGSTLGRARMDVVVWLRSLGLGNYEAVVRENDIDDTVLSSRKHGRSDTASSPSRANQLIA